MAACVKANAANPVVNSGVVAVGPIHLQRGAVRDTGGMLRIGLLPSHPQRIGRVEISYLVIFDVNLRHTIVCRWQQKVIIKTDLARTWFNYSVPIRPFLAS